MAGCCGLPFGTASRSVRVLLKVPVPALFYRCPLPPGPSLDEKTRSITVPVVVPASRSEGALHQGKAHWLDLPLQPLPPCIKRRAAYSVLLTERLYRLPTLLLTGNQLAPVLPLRSATRSWLLMPPLSPPVNSLRASGVHRMLTPWRQIGVEKKLQRERRSRQELRRRMAVNRFEEVGFFEIRKVLEDLILRHPGSEHIQHVPDGLPSIRECTADPSAGPV